MSPHAGVARWGRQPGRGGRVPGPRTGRPRQARQPTCAGHPSPAPGTCHLCGPGWRGGGRKEETGRGSAVMFCSQAEAAGTGQGRAEATRETGAGGERPWAPRSLRGGEGRRGGGETAASGLWGGTLGGSGGTRPGPCRTADAREGRGGSRAHSQRRRSGSPRPGQRPRPVRGVADGRTSVLLREGRAATRSACVMAASFTPPPPALPSSPPLGHRGCRCVNEGESGARTPLEFVMCPLGCAPRGAAGVRVVP